MNKVDVCISMTGHERRCQSLVGVIQQHHQSLAKPGSPIARPTTKPDRCSMTEHIFKIFV